MSKRCRVAVLISGAGSNLQALIDGQANGSLPIEIVTVISNKPDALGLERAQKARIACEALSHQDFDSRESFDHALANTIDQHHPDLIVLAGFMRILTPEFVRHYQGRMLNIHPSLLPKYPGLHTHQRVLDAGDSIHGVTVHFVTEELDGGPPIIQAIIPVFDDDTEETLMARIQTQEHSIYPTAVGWFATQRLQISNGKALLDNEELPSCGQQIRQL